MLAYFRNRRNAEFTPFLSYSGLSSEMRQRLAQTRFVPNKPTPVPPVVTTTPTSRDIRSLDTPSSSSEPAPSKPCTTPTTITLYPSHPEQPN